MNSYNKFFSVTFMLVGIATAMPVHSAEQPLSGQELQSMISDVDVSFSGKGISGITSYRIDGNVRTELNIGISDVGKWWIDGNQICTKWQRLRRGKETCFMIYRDSGATFRTSHGYTIQTL